ncbi:MAG: Universal stress protein family protein [Rhodospirillales bacterium]|nr:Universal stress protein family protein [Rhodospirillales bacterium]
MQSLLALIDGSENDAPSLRAAAGMANAIGGKLTVAHFKPAELVPIGTFEMAAVMPNNTAAAEEARRRAQSAYAEECSQLADCRLQGVDGGIAEAIERLSPYHDLVVLERLSEVGGPDAMAFSAALWDAGCPVLVTPAPANSPSAVRHVAVAWNGSAQAGRAVRAAMPYLQKAAQVTILQRSGSADDTELKRYLAVHGVGSVLFRTYGQGHLSGRGWGRALLAEAKAVGADLLVMGAYGSAMGNLLGFGRATEKIVTSAPLPVLLSA